MKVSEFKKLVREEITKELSKKRKLPESFNAQNQRHQKAAMALSEFLKTKIATFMEPRDCAELLNFMATDIKNADDYEDGLEYYSSVH